MTTLRLAVFECCILIFTQRRSVAKFAEERWMFSAASVCLFVCVFVCQHDNFRKSKHRMIKRGGRCIVQKSRPSSNLGVIDHWKRTPPPNVAFGHDVGKVSAGCVVFTVRLHVMQRTVLLSQFCPSVCPSIRQPDACIATKLNKVLRIFRYHTKRQSL